ncbi:MAG: hypothetical protein EP329_20100 [Deltaproteobacteria bacterium]|nr:MAG: hypothetical protein EP329_20100 [Deltaproteobacteria bacterium]
MAYEQPARQREEEAKAPKAQKEAGGAAVARDSHAALRGHTYDEQVQMLAPVQMKGEDEAASAASAAQAQTQAPGADAGFSDLYKNKGGKKKGEVTADRGRSLGYEDYKERIGPIKASSETREGLLPYQKKGAAAQQMTVELSEDDLLEIFSANYGKNTMKSSDDDNARIKALLPKVNAAFRIMKLDTIGAKAAYLANAYWESAKFKYMTETEAAAGGKGWQQDPRQTKLDTGYLGRAAAGQEKVGELKVAGYHQGGTINKTGDWNESFIGRGPLQVTHDYGYVQTLAVIERRWEELKDAKEGTQEAKDRDLCKEALDAIKKDPSQAANPKYAFLFSAAFMKRPTSQDLKSRPGDQLATGGSAASFMGQQPKERGAEKAAVYQKAVEVLTLRQKSWDIAHETGPYAPEAA